MHVLKPTVDSHLDKANLTLSTQPTSPQPMLKLFSALAIVQEVHM